MKVRWLLLVLVLVMGVGATAVMAQEDALLRIGQIDISDFPIVRLRVLTADSQSVPLADLSNLSLREDGTPIADFEMQVVPVGVDVIFVLDDNSTMDRVDEDSGFTRREIVQASIVRFAQRVMSPAGLDRVSVVVPESASSGRFLVEDVADSQALITAVETYTPRSMETTPLNDMLALALDHAAQLHGDGRFQAILLITDGNQLDQQLPFGELVEQAQTIHLPIFAAIPGSLATFDAIDNLVLLTEPTRASYVRLPTAAAADPIYLIWQRQGNQPQITYESRQTRSGSYPITVSVGDLTARTTLELALEPPQVEILFEGDVVRRVGEEPDAPLSSLQPAVQSIPVAVGWPDGLPRPLTAVTLLVNGAEEPLPENIAPDEEGIVTLDWAIENRGSDIYELVVQVEDEFGFTAVSDPLLLAIAEERPSPPTPTAVATAAPQSVENVPALSRQDTVVLALSGVGGVAALALLALRRRRRPRRPVAARLPEPRTAVRESPPPAAVPSQVAYLELLQESAGDEAMIPLQGENITIGRDQNVAQVSFQDAGVDPLHARIRKRNGTYWLYDEGSATGTRLNFQKVGLTPRELHDGDTVHIGRLTLRFHLKPQAEAPEE